MKSRGRFLALAVALILICNLMAPAFAAGSTDAAAAREITATLSTNITVEYKGEAQSMTDANGDPVYPVSYNGTTYLPIRAVSNILGLAVDWDQATKTVLLSLGGEATAVKAADSAAKPAVQSITAQLSPDITVKYEGRVQTMRDANGDVVYPISYNDTTYLPVRAVSNMLNIAVDWDQTTKTVLLAPSGTGEGEDVMVLTPAGEIMVNTGDEAGAYKALSAIGLSDAEISMLLAQVDFISSDALYGFQTSSDAKILGERHIGYDYAEIDWSMASEGYVKVRLNDQLTKLIRCCVRWNDGETSGSMDWVLSAGRWFHIPLFGGSAEYAISIDLYYSEDEFEQIKNGADDLYRDSLQARFMAEINNPDIVWTLSTIDIDYENAPLTCAKALEITKNCKTDAEKITKVFNWVAQNIKYDYDLADEIKAWTILKNSEENDDGSIINPVYDLFQDGARAQLALDDILTSKSGVCEDFATLMAGMLRSLGIPCKYVGGDVYTGNIVEGYSDDGWAPHGWVAVSPDIEGLNMSALGAGHEADGWIRLDPTWGSTAEGRAAAAVDKNHTADRCY